MSWLAILLIVIGSLVVLRVARTMVILFFSVILIILGYIIWPFEWAVKSAIKGIMRLLTLGETK